MPSCYSCCGVIWFVLAGPILDLLYTLLSLDYSDPALLLGLHSCYLGFLDPFHCVRASSAHFFLLGHPWPTPILHSHELLLILLGFPGPITISFTFGVHGLFINPLLTYFITSGLFWLIIIFLLPMVLLLHSLGSFRPICFFQGPFIMLWAYDSLFLSFGLISFSLNLLTLSAHIVGFFQNEHQ